MLQQGREVGASSVDNFEARQGTDLVGAGIDWPWHDVVLHN